MITHNGTYLLHATHHGMPIVAATMGGKMVFGSRWLLPLTLQAIVAAFGAEGTEVIRKTNDYLNRIATTDPQRALQISGFINEDPLLVCSLVETSKTRWLVGDGKSWIDTDFIAEGGMHAIINIKPVANVMWIIGSHNTKAQGNANQYNRNEIRLYDGSDVTVNVLNMGTNNKKGTLYPNQSNILEMVSYGNPYYIVNGTRYDIAGVSGVLHPLNSVRIFYGYYDDMPYGNNVGLAYTELRDSNDEPVRYLVPCYTKAQGNGMLDIISGTFHPNANTEGSFTIAITDHNPRLMRGRDNL
jgi:hypothetical protein